MAIYFHIPPNGKNPSGGVKQLYSMADALNNNGFESYVIIRDSNDYAQWFQHNTPYVVQGHHLKKGDVSVIPEMWTNLLHENSNDIKKVVFNQSAHISIHQTGIETLQREIKAGNCHDMIFVSQQNINLLAPYFPDIKHHLYKYNINKNIFFMDRNKKIQVAYMPRKGMEYMTEIIENIDLPTVAIDGMHEIEVAKTLRESLILLCYSSFANEGFFLPPAEAMACGCFPVGGFSGGYEDYYNSNYMFVDYNNQKCINQINSLVYNFTENRDEFYKKAEEMSNYITDTYSTEKYISNIISIWDNILETK